MVKYINKKHSYIDKTVKIGKGTIIYPNVIIEGNSIIGVNCIIHMGCYIKDTVIGDNNVIYSSHIIDSKIGDDNQIGPYAHIRENNDIRNNIKIGSFVEVKNNVIDNNSKVPHLIYLGDSEIGKNVNVGCGSITANYDGKKKHKTVIKDNAFIGCNTTLIAPITIGKDSFVGAGSTVTENIPNKSLAISNIEEIIKKDYNNE